MTRILEDVKRGHEETLKILKGFFPKATFQVTQEPYLSHFITGAISDEGLATVVLMSIPTAMLTGDYRRRIETVRAESRMAVARLHMHLRVDDMRRVTFVEPAVARVIYDANVAAVLQGTKKNNARSNRKADNINIPETSNT